jgi:hypothetical protein
MKSPYKLIKLGIFKMSITSSKISFGTQFKAHIGANHAARHLHLKKLGNKQKKEKVVRSILTSTVRRENWGRTDPPQGLDRRVSVQAVAVFAKKVDGQLGRAMRHIDAQISSHGVNLLNVHGVVTRTLCEK